MAISLIIGKNTELDYIKENIVESAGCLIPWAGKSGTVPTGWLICNGAAVSRTTYSRLFAAIGTTWGVGDGVNTFNLPNLESNYSRGVDGTASRDPDKATRTATNGGNSGNNIGSYQTYKTKTPVSSFTTNSHSHLHTFYYSVFGPNTADILPSPGPYDVYSPSGSYKTVSSTMVAHTITGTGDTATIPDTKYLYMLVSY